MYTNQSLNRRDLLRGTLAASLASWTLSDLRAEESAVGDLQLTPFRFDVTPPIGHSCCGGWIKPVEVVDDSLDAIGFVLFGIGKPIVLCAVDWTGLLNGAHIEWRKALAEAAGTTPERVAVQCVHQHNAPFACLEAERIVASQGDLPHIVDLDFFRRCLDRGRSAVGDAVKQARPVTHIAISQGKVDRVASNRRVFRDENGRIKAMRGSSCRDPKLQAMPEGLVDPWMKTVALYDNDKKIVACHYYATHPMSYYGDGHVTSDFAGLARKQRQKDEPDCAHIYFTGCAGNISAGKYNDGSKERRPILTQRVYDGIVASEKDLKPQPIEQVGWKTADLIPSPRETLSAEALVAQIGNKDNAVVARNRPSYMLSWLRRVEQQIPIVLSSLRLNDASLLHLPAECFIEYQLRAQKLGGDSRFVATAAYGDGGPWYIPVKEEYPAGGYEVSVAFCSDDVDTQLTKGIQSLL
ncbi:MAG: hypothetical protein CMJ64_26645 [Planctomycetaceae bacterium]|nr:hypothetical protein [Planctomycetaceae bacterium]